MKITSADLPELSTGAVFLATGGGGDPYVMRLIAERALERFGAAEVVAPDALADDACVVTIGGVGAPTASLELLPSMDEAERALAAFEAEAGRRVDAVVSFEIGGANSLVPIIAAAQRGIPVVDGDGMGRALPEAQMMTYPIAGICPTPAVAVDYRGTVETFSTRDIFEYERQIRQYALSHGGMVTACEHPMSGSELKASVVAGTLGFSIELGALLHRCGGRADKTLAQLDALFAPSIYGEVRHLYTGKVVDTERRIEGGFDCGIVRLAAFEPGWDELELTIKNEFLLARLGERVVASVPDLIAVLDYETSMPINAERLRYGQRVMALGIGCPPFYRTERALRVVAPRCFGFDIEYLPLERLAPARPRGVAG